MFGNIFTTKYIDHMSPIVDFHIRNTCISNSLVDIWATIKLMTKETMDRLKLPSLWQTPTILQLANQSTVKPKGILEYVVVSVYS
jgi:hypothetical protein